VGISLISCFWFLVDLFRRFSVDFFLSLFFSFLASSAARFFSSKSFILSAQSHKRVSLLIQVYELANLDSPLAPKCSASCRSPPILSDTQPLPKTCSVISVTTSKLVGLRTRTCRFRLPRIFSTSYSSSSVPLI
jgi:hypothetical protein